MSRVLPIRKQTRIGRLLADGFGVREIASIVGASKITVNRYRKIIVCNGAVRLICPCGAAAGHRGWCSWRYQRSPARQALHTGRSHRAVTRKAEPGDIMKTVYAALPIGLPSFIRDEVAGDILLAVYEGQFVAADVGRKTTEFLRRYYRKFDSKYKFVSLDAPVGVEGRPLHEILAAPA